MELIIGHEYQLRDLIDAGVDPVFGVVTRQPYEGSSAWLVDTDRTRAELESVPGLMDTAWKHTSAHDMDPARRLYFFVFSESNVHPWGTYFGTYTVQMSFCGGRGPMEERDVTYLSLNAIDPDWHFNEGG